MWQADAAVKKHLNADSGVENVTYLRPYGDIRDFVDKYAAQSDKKKVRAII